MKRFIAGLLLSGMVWSTAVGQIFQGPASGSVPNGGVVSTEGMLNVTNLPIDPNPAKVRNKIPYRFESDALNEFPSVSLASEGSNFVADRNASGQAVGLTEPILLNNFPGIPQTNSIPPDPYCAMGPTHFIAVVNTSFRIYDRAGNIETTITADLWFNNVFPNSGAFDPKVTYDHISKRWIMVWLQQDDNTLTGTHLVSVSDDSIPTGTWYNWALPSTVNGSTSAGNWSDYQGVGFDSQAVYITANQFSFGGGFNYVKLRIIPKSVLYNNPGGPLSWMDLWDIREPLSTGSRIFTLRPARMHGNPGEYYLITRSPFSDPENFVVVYTLTNPTTSPSLTGDRISVTDYSTPPLADQLGGSTIGIESGGSHFRNEPVYRDGYLWATHAVASGGGAYGSVNLLKIDLGTNTASDDITFGMDGFWYFYPALAVDSGHNTIVTYSRSGLTEYIGAYYSGRLSGDPPGVIIGSYTLAPGEANYVKDFGSGRNRWGDYMGAWVDPADDHTFWIFTEYAESPANTWGTWVGHVLLSPFLTARAYASVDTLRFEPQEVGTISTSRPIIVRNVGGTQLSINNMNIDGTNFDIASSHSYPILLNFGDSVVVNVTFSPTSRATFVEDLVITSNDAADTARRVPLTGFGYVINPAVSGKMYSAGTAGGGSLYELSLYTSGAEVGPTGYSEIKGLAVRNSNHELYGFSIGTVATIVRINSELGDAYPVVSLPVTTLRAIEFDLNDTLYGVLSNGRIITINLTTGDTTMPMNTGITNLLGLGTNPLTGQLWAFKTDGKSYRIDLAAGTATLVGSAGTNFLACRDIAFSPTGVLYGLANANTDSSRIISIDTTTGVGTVVRETGVNGLTGLAFHGNVVGVRNDEPYAPKGYRLMAAYPNPFNPSTTIGYELPVASRVTIKIFNSLGQEVRTLVNGTKDRGAHTVVWDGRSDIGHAVGSGVYLYRIEAGSYTKTLKMILLK